MLELVERWFAYFSAETGVLGPLREYQEVWTALLIIWAAAFCFWGLHSYRLVFSLNVFMAVTLALCWFLRGWVTWGGAIVTAFAIIGGILAFIAYEWKYAGAFFLGAVIAGTFLFQMRCSLLIVILGGVLGGILVYNFPVIGVSFGTACFGGFMLSELITFSWLSGWPSAILFTVAGFAIQMLLSKKQTLFGKKYPASIQHYLEERKRRKQL